MQKLPRINQKKPVFKYFNLYTTIEVAEKEQEVGDYN